MTAATHYFVWYRISGDAARARTAANALLREMALHAGVTGRLLMRRDDPTTWMEVFENVIDTARFDSALAEATVRSGIDACVPGGRHVERFVVAP